jgi:hypothetical protein
MKTTILTARPQTWNNHYLNKDSQGALICESKNWPKNSEKQTYKTSFYSSYFNILGRDEGIGEQFAFSDKSYEAEIPDNTKIACAYSDRISQWDYARYEAANKIAGTGCQGWAQALPKLSEEEFLHFAAVALNLEDKKIFAARAVHHFNVSNGYSCPTIEAIYYPTNP